MTIPRSQIIDTELTPWYHCISQCVRQAFLMKDESGRHKRWIEDRLELLSRAFSIGVGGYSVLDNHLHLIVRLDPDCACNWAPEEVLRRWLIVVPAKSQNLKNGETIDEWIERRSCDREFVGMLRERLSNLGWFMKLLKEPLARIINKEDGCTGAFWAARYKSIAILDEEALLMTAAYVDLNPLAAGLAFTPEKSKHTSLAQRIKHVKSLGRLECLAAAGNGSVAGIRDAGDIEQTNWLVPINDRRVDGDMNSVRAGMIDSFSLGSYLLVVDFIGRLYRHKKARMGDDVRQVFDRLGISLKSWSTKISEMLNAAKFRGHYFGSSRAEIRKLAKRRGKRTTNLTVKVA